MSVPSRLGPYVELTPLGRGGMGTVYAGRHEELGALRALKVLGEGASDSEQARLLREARTLARVRHRNLVAVHEAGVSEGLLYYAMDRIEGRSLAELLAAGRLERALARRLARELCAGVAALHAAGVVHRDLKPANVMVRQDGSPVVIDLGLALSLERDTRLTRSGALLGTASYMAPEQVRDASSVDARADVYALGLILFELFSGHSATPRGATLPEVVSSILHSERPRLRARDPALPPSLDALVARCLARDPAQRPADAGALGAALEGAEEPAAVEPPVWALALITLGLFLLVGALAWRTAPGGAPLEPTLAATRPAPAGPTLSELEREPSPARRLAGLLELARREPDHPEGQRLRELLVQARWAAPVRGPAGGHLGGCFLGEERLLSGGGDTGRVQLWRLEGEGLRPEESWPCDPRFGSAGIAPLGGVGAGFLDGGRWWWLAPTGAPARVEGGYNRWLQARRHAASGLEVGLKVSHDSPRSELVVSNLLELRRPGQEQTQVHFLHELVACMELTPDGERLVFSTRPSRRGEGGASSLRVLRLADTEELGRLPLFSEALCLALSPEGELAAVGTRTGQLALYRLQPLELILPLASGKRHTSTVSPARRYFVTGAAFAAEGRLIYSAGTREDGRQGSFAVWDVESGAELFRWELGYGVRGLALSPSRGRLALFGADQIEVRRVPRTREGWRVLSRAKSARRR